MGDSLKYKKVDSSDIDDSKNQLDLLRSISESSLYSDSSCESLPIDAPLARQTRCSIDIDTIEPLTKSIPMRKNGIAERRNTYLDNLQLSDSIQEISYVLIVYFT